MNKFKVLVSRICYQHQWFEVEAPHEGYVDTAAIELAVGFDWSDNPTIDVEFESVDIITEVQQYIIGYKAPCVLFESGVHRVYKGDLYVKVDEMGYVAKDEKRSVIGIPYWSYLPKEIVESWEPVYDI